MKNIVFLLAAMMFGCGAMAQHEGHNHDHTTEHKESHHHEHGKHKLALYGAFTHIPGAFYEHETHQVSTGKYIPTLGLDYFYTVNSTWNLGLMIDGELDSYYIEIGEDKELERNNILIMAAVAKYKPCGGLGVFAGPGVEWEFKENPISFWVIKTGIEYEIAINDKGWELIPSFSYDFKEEYSSYGFGLALAKRF